MGKYSKIRSSVQPRAVGGGTRGQPQILADLEVGKDLTPFGDVADPEPERAMRRLAGDVLALEAHGAGPGWGEPHDRAQRGGLAGAVAAEEHGDLARRHREGDVAQHVALAVEGLERLDRQQRVSSGQHG